MERLSGGHDPGEGREMGQRLTTAINRAAQTIPHGNGGSTKDPFPYGARDQLIPLFVLSRRHPPSPDALCYPGLVDVLRRERS